VATKGGYIPFDGAPPGDPQRWFHDTFVRPGIAGAGDVVAGCHCMTPAYLEHQLDCSRRNLGIECLDVYYIHNPEQQLDEVPRPEFLRRLRAAFERLEKLAGEGRLVYVISTKGKRFVEALLAWQKVPIPPERVIGRVTPKREKWDTMRDLAATHGLRADGGDIWFVEDRLTTLIDFRHSAPDLRRARLFLADWGYIFPERDPDEARTAGIPVLTLAQMTRPFEGWPSA
jgi:hypothetical protein